MQVVPLLTGSCPNSTLNASPHTSRVNATCVDLHRIRRLPSLTRQPVAVELSTCVLHVENATTVRRPSVRADIPTPVNANAIGRPLLQVVPFPAGVTVQTVAEMCAVL